MKTDGIQSRFEFRKIDGRWQRREKGGPWCELVVTHRPVNRPRGESIDNNEWQWVPLKGE